MPHAFRTPVAAPGFLLTSDPADPSATQYGVGTLIGASVAASTAITGATETVASFDTTVTVPANAMQAGTVLHIKGQGTYTATTGSETHDLLLKLGATTLVTKASVDPATGQFFAFDFWLTIRTAGGSGTMVGHGLSMGAGGNGSGTTVMDFLASTAVDTTTAKVVSVAIDRQASATDGDSARLDQISVVAYNLAALA
jgi:hypothetical protein